ncbi:hypothetical protein P9D43_20380 [Neobacillus niacini]|uniref:hypothetical protein n=1 Tax=Neobacillus niacini TaxID=86668 RepID=UPI0007ABFD13|nr:hypothetical protein [Neobacillus niacini]MEC1524361.1 hypothetical protein [Neobacillus niacini]
MIDTFELTTNVGITQREIDSRFNISEDSKQKVSDSVYIVLNPLHILGVQKLIVTRLQNTLLYEITLVFNAQQLLEKRMTPSLFIPTKANVKELQRRVEMIHQDVQLSYKQWTLTRIDYAMQFKTPHHALYPYLESCSTCPSSDIQTYEYGSLQRRNGNSILNAYSKELQTATRNHVEQYKIEAHNLYRWERQCIRPYDLKLNNIGLGSHWTRYFTEAAALEALMRFHKHHIKKGDYYSRDAAYEQLKSKIKRSNNLTSAMKTLDFIRNEGSITNALQAITEGRQTVPDQFNNRLNNAFSNSMQKRFNDYIRLHLSQNGVNPVLLPKDCEEDFLQNSHHYLFGHLNLL